MATVTIIEVLQTALSAVLSLTIFVIAWILSYHFSLQRQSRGLLIVSRGFLVKWAIDGAWDAYFYGLLGGPIGIVSSSLNSTSARNIGETLNLYYWTATAISTVSLTLMVLLIIKGALAIGREQPRQTTSLPTPP